MSTAAPNETNDEVPGSEATRRAVVMASTLALVYIFLCGFYIAFSSDIAAQISSSVSQLHKLELVKGLIFVLVTGLTSFGLSYFFLRRVLSQEDRIRRQERALAAAEGRAMAGIFASSIAHDMGNLLTAIRINLYLLRENEAASGGARSLQDLDRATNDLGDLVTRLAVIGRDKKPDQMHLVDLAMIVEKVATFAPTHSAIRRCAVTTRIFTRPHLVADDVMVSRMLVNLVLNAAEAVGKGGRIEIQLVEDSSVVRLEVHDNGPGVPQDMRNRVFDPFFTTKEHGTGLGLLSVKVCAEEHRGSVEILDSPLGGALFRVNFPLTPPA